VRTVEELRNLRRTELAWAGYIVGGSLLLFSVAVVVGMALSALSFVWGGVVAFVLLGLVTAVLGPELRTLWQRLPR
jgi:hypothetical protein